TRLYERCVAPQRFAGYSRRHWYPCPETDRTSAEVPALRQASGIFDLLPMSSKTEGFPSQGGDLCNRLRCPCGAPPSMKQASPRSRGAAIFRIDDMPLRGTTRNENTRRKATHIGIFQSSHSCPSGAPSQHENGAPIRRRAAIYTPGLFYTFRR